MERSLELCKTHMMNVTDRAITQFKLSIVVRRQWWNMVDGWLSLVSRSKVEELDLYIWSRSYPLPHDILHLRSLTHLRLNFLGLKDLHSVCLPSLMSLYLQNVDMDDQALHKLLSGCWFLERLALDDCVKLSNAVILSLNLKSVEIIGRKFNFKLKHPGTSRRTATYRNFCPSFHFSCSCYGTLGNLSFTRVSSMISG